MGRPEMIHARAECVRKLHRGAICPRQPVRDRGAVTRAGFYNEYPILMSNGEIKSFCRSFR